MEYKYEKIVSKCPLCSNVRGLLLHQLTSEEVVRYLTSKKDPQKFSKLKKEIEKLWGGNRCKKILCTNCSLIYASPFIAGNSKIYSLLYSSADKYPKERWDYDLTLDAIKKLPKDQRKSLLEIGAGIGVFLKMIPLNLIENKNLVACEISDIGREELSRQRIKNYKDFFSDKILEKFSVICLFDTIEHLDRLDILFKKIRKVSSDGANIFITTHVKNTLEFLETHGAGIDIPPIHISCWDKKSFEILKSRYGLELVGRKTNGGSLFRRMLNFGLGTFETRKLTKRSLEDRIDNINNRKIRKMMIATFLLAFSPYLFIQTITRNLDSVQWIHLKRVSHYNK